MVVIVIIGILVALLLPVIVGAVRKANEARVAGEIQTLASGLSTFKNKFGEYPPSRIILNENGVYSVQGAFPNPQQNDFITPLSSSSISWISPPSAIGQNDISFGELAQRSLRALRKFFPRARLTPQDLNGDNSIDALHDYWPDFNGNANGPRTTRRTADSLT